jgi:hypothetical protein
VCVREIGGKNKEEPMQQGELAGAVTRLVAAMQDLSDGQLSQPWRWRAHQEGVRFALFRAYQELRELEVELAHERATQGPTRNRAQRALAPYHAAYRDLQAVLLPAGEEIFDQPPGPGDWSLRDILAHTINTQRLFFTLVHYGLRRQHSEEALSPRLPEGEVEQVVGPRNDFLTLYEEGSMQDLLDHFDDLHWRALSEFAAISDEEIEGPSVWWEEETFSLQYRIHRFDAHLRQHTVQAEKALDALGRRPSEARRLLRLVYQALAAVESSLIGAPQLGRERRHEVARTIEALAEAATVAVQQARDLLQAVTDGDAQQVNALLKANSDLGTAVDNQGLPLVLQAVYRGQSEIAQTLAAACPELDIFMAAALGRQDVAEELVAQWDGYVNEVALDGFTPLQLACFFGHESLALWLMEQGADVNAVAQNNQRIQPIHAAAANGNVRVVEALLQHGADANARQQGDFTALHTAAMDGNEEMARLLLEHGADPTAQDSRGRTPLDLAREYEQEAVIALLSER